MTATVSARHATWVLELIHERGALTRRELANELRYLRPRILTAGHARRVIDLAVRRLVARGELEQIGTDHRCANLYAVTDRGHVELDAAMTRLAAIGRTPADVLPIHYPNGDTE